MSILSVDIAIRSWSDLGIVLLETTESSIVCETMKWEGAHRPPVVELALRLNATCLERGARVLMLDGPQAWRSEDIVRDRLCANREAKPPEKLASSGITIPENYDRFVGYCLALYDALGRLGWRRPTVRDRRSISSRSRAGEQRILLESYPQAAWKSLGIAPLPAKEKCRVSDLAQSWRALIEVVPLTINRPPNYREIQAIVAGLPGFAFDEERNGASDADHRQSPLKITDWVGGINAPLRRPPADPAMAE